MKRVAIPILLLACAGCAMQNELVTVNEDIESVQERQQKLDDRLAHLEESAEVLRGLTVRIQTIEKQLGGMNDGLATRVDEELSGMQTTVDELRAARDAADARVLQAEAMLADRMQELARWQRETDRLLAERAAEVRQHTEELNERVIGLEQQEAQLTRLAELTDQLTLLGVQVTERLDAQTSDFQRISARLDRVEGGVELFQQAPPPWGDQLDQKVSYLADELAPQVDRHDRSILKLAGNQEMQRNSLRYDVLSDRLNTLGTELVQRLDRMDGQIADMERAEAMAEHTKQNQVASLRARLDVLGGEVPEAVDRVSRNVQTLLAHLEQVSQRIRLLETIQKSESAELRERLNTLSEAISDLNRTAGAHP